MIYFLIALFILIPIVLGLYLFNYEDSRKDLGSFGGRHRK